MASTEKNDYEKYFEWWLDVLKENKLVIEYEWQPKAFILERAVPIYYEQKYKTKKSIYNDFNLFQPITYTTDYRVVFDVALMNKLFGVFFKDEKKMLSDPDINVGNVYQNTLFYATEKGLIFEEDTPTIKHVEIFFDVKPSAKAVQYSGKLGSSRDFKFNQRLVYNKHGIYVNKVVPIGSSTCLYNKTFTPYRYTFTDNGFNKKEPRCKMVKTKVGEITTKVKTPITQLDNFRSFDDWLELKGIK